MLLVALFIYTLCVVPIILAALHISRKLGYLLSIVAGLVGIFLLFLLKIGFLPVISSIFVFGMAVFIIGRFNDMEQESVFTVLSKKGGYEENFEQLKNEENRLSKEAQELDIAVAQIMNLYEIGHSFGMPLKFDSLFEVLCRVLQGLFKFDFAKLMLIKENLSGYEIEEIYLLKCGAEMKPEARSTAPAKDDEGLLKAILSKDDKVFIDNGLLAYPLTSADKILGILAIYGIESGQEARLQIIANQFAFALERVRLYEIVQEMSIIDGLTNIFVRRHFLQRMEEEISRAAKRNLNFSFMMMDIDHFKKCNDTFGHLVGDVVLKELANILKNNLREVDLIGRYGGEEFSALLPDAEKKEASAIAERIRAAVENSEIKAYDEEIKTTISIGVASFPMDADNILELIERADNALYKAKETGRNRVCTFNDK